MPLIRGCSCVIALLGWSYSNRCTSGKPGLFLFGPKPTISCTGIATRACPRLRAGRRAAANSAQAHQRPHGHQILSLVSG